MLPTRSLRLFRCFFWIFKFFFIFLKVTLKFKILDKFSIQQRTPKLKFTIGKVRDDFLVSLFFMVSIFDSEQ